MTPTPAETLSRLRAAADLLAGTGASVSLPRPDLFGSATPAQLAAYLRGHGWALAQDWPTFADWRYETPGPDRGDLVRVPKDVRFTDYARAVRSVCVVCGEIEGREDWSVLADVMRGPALIEYATFRCPSCGQTACVPVRQPVEWGVYSPTAYSGRCWCGGRIVLEWVRAKAGEKEKP